MMKRKRKKSKEKNSSNQSSRLPIERIEKSPTRKNRRKQKKLTKKLFLKTRKKSRRLVKKKSKMKNCEVVIIVVSVLNSSNFSKKNPGIISGYPEIKKPYSSSREKKKKH